MYQLVCVRNLHQLVCIWNLYDVPWWILPQSHHNWRSSIQIMSHKRVTLWSGPPLRGSWNQSIAVGDGELAGDEGWWHLIRGVWSFQPLFGFNNFCYNNDFRGTENMCLMMYMIYLCLEVVWWIFWYCQYVFLSRTGMINLCFYPIGSDDLKSDCPLVLWSLVVTDVMTLFACR
jgi:hypothetical protein